MGGEQRIRRRRVAALAARSGGVVSRDQLRQVGVDRNVIGREVRADRWQLHGLQTVAVHTAPLAGSALLWRAVWEVGRGAALDGVSALQAVGLEQFESSVVHVSIQHDLVAPEVPGVRVHRVRDVQLADTTGAGIPRVRPQVATVRGAQWAASHRQAALVLCLAVQQRLVRPADLVDVRWPGAHYGRTQFVRQVITDVRDGAHSLGELDFAAMCRARGIPAPSRQVVRHGPRGRIYLDVRWDHVGVVVEIDGAQHRQGLAIVSDHLRRNDLALADDVVLTIDLVGLRLEADAFLDQVEAAIRIRSARR